MPQTGHDFYVYFNEGVEQYGGRRCVFTASNKSTQCIVNNYYRPYANAPLGARFENESLYMSRRKAKYELNNNSSNAYWTGRFAA